MPSRRLAVLASLGILGLGAPGCWTGQGAAAAGASGAAPLHVTYLGVSGFLLQSGGDAVLTAPLFTRPTMLDLGAAMIASSPIEVERGLPTAALQNVRAVLTGHAHYDHLLDVPNILARAPRATLYANVSARSLLAAYAPDRGPRCVGTPPTMPRIPRPRVVALDDPRASLVDWTYCPDRRPPGAPVAGTWVGVPDSHVRILALCSEHPEQLGPMHYAPGGVEEDACVPPRRAEDWREGQTLAFLVDFLDPRTNAPAYRVYFQDAPTNAPLGHVPPALLADKRVDLALLCVGAYEHVAGAPTNALAAIAPRYALGGHWEDFFRPAAAPPEPIPFEDLATWVARARAAMPWQGEPRPMLENGAPAAARVVVPRPGEVFDVFH
jgi:hypothetical protein